MARRFPPGADYVPVFPRTLTDARLYDAQVRSPKTCEHIVSVCIECVCEWEKFWDIHYHRTRAGRRLARKLEVLRATGEMVGLSQEANADWRSHWANWTGGSVRVDVMDRPDLQASQCKCGAYTYAEHTVANFPVHTYSGPYQSTQDSPA